MSPKRLFNVFALIAAVGFLTNGLESIEARNLNQQELDLLARGGQQQVGPNSLPYLLEAAAQSSSSASSNRQDEQDPFDSDSDDDDDDERAGDSSPGGQQGNLLQPAGTDLFYGNKRLPMSELSGHQQGRHASLAGPPASSDLNAAASYHHKGHGAKGWLDMGAWTGKKGAFGWYDKHPVGKGK